MATYLLDTSAILAHYRDEVGTKTVEELFDDDSAEVCISSLSITELARRILELGSDSATARAESLVYAGLASRVIPVDAAVAIRAFELGAAATSRLPLIDALIAASAAISGAILVHRDSHFDALPEGLPERLFLAR